MNHPSTMRMAHYVTDAQQQFQGPIDIPFRRRWLVDLFPHIFQGCSRKKLSGIIRPAVRIESHVKNGQDAGMFQLAGDLGFRQKTIYCGLGSNGFFRYALHRRAAPESKSQTLQMSPCPPPASFSRISYFWKKSRRVNNREAAIKSLLLFCVASDVRVAIVSGCARSAVPNRHSGQMANG